MNALFLNADGRKDDGQCLPETLLKAGMGLAVVGVGEDGGTGIERKLDRDRESARAEKKATMSREKGSFFKKVFSFTKKKDPPIAL